MKKLTTTMLFIAAIAVAPAADHDGGLLGGTSGGGQQQQHSDKLQELPQQARELLMKEAQKHEARISDIDEKEDNGVKYYKITFENQDRSWNASILEQGLIVGIDQGETIAWTELPQVVRDQLQQEAKDGAMITEIITTRRDGELAYLVEIEQEGKAHDLLISPLGKKLPLQATGGSSSGGQMDTGHSQKELQQKELQKARDKAIKDLEKAGDKSERQLEKTGEELERKLD